MKYAVLGTGTVGRTVAARLAELGHEVVIGTRDPEATLARTDGDAPYAAWAADHSGVSLATFADAAAGAEVVVHAGSGLAALDLLGSAGADHLAGKVLVDISNPLDFSAGFPPTLFVKDTDSLGEQIQRAFPQARVVKTLNTLTADLMVRPDLLPETSSVFVSGDDAEAKAIATAMLTEFGHTDVIDLGDLSTARGTEMLLPVWLRLMGSLGTATFNFKIVR
jgi:predicted dinucleotide-binding enzyme